MVTPPAPHMSFSEPYLTEDGQTAYNVVIEAPEEVKGEMLEIFGKQLLSWYENECHGSLIDAFPPPVGYTYIYGKGPMKGTLQAHTYIGLTPNDPEAMKLLRRKNEESEETVP